MGVYVVRTLSLNDKHSCQLFRKASSLVLLSSSVSTANLSYLLATTFSSLRFLFNFTSLQSFESGQRYLLATTFSSLRFLFNFTSLQSFESGQRYFLIFASSSILSLSFLCSFVSEALFTLSFTFVSERFFFVMIKLL